MTRIARHRTLVVALLATAWPAVPAAAQQWRDEANARIAEHRMGDLAITVVDALGNPVRGANVDVAMTRHAFEFGSAVTAQRLTGTSADDAIYREKFLENFNGAVFENDLKWPAWIGLWGPSFNWPQTEQAFDWLDANRIPTRGHHLAWGTWSGPDAWGDSQDVQTLPARLFAHMAQKAGTVGDRVHEWDVLNHPIGWLGDTYVNRFEDAGLYQDGLDVYADIVRHGRNVVPAGTDLWINEDNILAGGQLADAYESVVEHLIASDAAPDGIGFQGHFVQEWGRISAPESVYARIDRFAQLGLPLRVTELDVDVGGNEQLQALLLRDYLTVMFSHEAMEAVTMWGFSEADHWRPDAALYRSDWSEKPALQAYRDLVFGAWWTDEALATGDAGLAELRAFLGEYAAAATLAGVTGEASFALGGEGADVTIALDLVLGDADLDGTVDLADFGILRANFGSAGADFATGDFDGDGAVTLADFGILRSNFGSALSADLAVLDAWAASVPEPSAAFAAACGLGLLARRRR